MVMLVVASDYSLAFYTIVGNPPIVSILPNTAKCAYQDKITVFYSLMNEMFMMQSTSSRMGFDLLPPQVLHDHIQCDHCLMAPIEGLRYKCMCCPDYDLCEACVAINDSPRAKFHNEDHYFIRIPHSLKDDKKNTCNITRSSISMALSCRRRMIHKDTYCSNCEELVVGFRYFCTVCGINICESCEFISHRFHDIQHALMKMIPPPAEATNSLNYSKNGKSSSSNKYPETIEEQFELIKAMLEREEELRLSHETMDLIRMEGPDNYGNIMHRIQLQVAHEFGYVDDEKVGLDFIRCAETILKSRPDLVAIVKETSYYRKFNRCMDGSIVVGGVAPKLPKLHAFNDELTPVDIFHTFHDTCAVGCGREGPITVLMAGSYS